MKARTDNAEVEMNIDNTEWKFNSVLCANYFVLLAESENDVQKLGSEFSSVCESRKLKVNVDESEIQWF